MKKRVAGTIAVIALLLAAILLASYSRPPATTQQKEDGFPPDKGTASAIVTNDGVNLAHTFHQGGVARPTLIFLHMAGRDRHDYDYLALRANELGYSTLQIDMRGHGQNSSKHASFGPSDWQKMLLDVSAAKQFVKRQGLNSSRLVLVGASIGANLAATYAAQDKAVIGLVMLSPGFDYHGIQPETSIKALKIPTFLAVSDDDTTSWQASRQFAGETAMQFQIYSSAGHGTEMLESTNVGSIMLIWMQELW
jgi:alpha-beta hydrolase superfamily lysophospholipase